MSIQGPSSLDSSEEGELASSLIATKAFQRLGSVRFLGAIDYVLVRAPNGSGLNVRHTRYEHSIGVANLALRHANRVGMDQAGRRLSCAVALLHDIGHAPLSHTIEPVFKEAFGIDHHRATGDIVTGRAVLGREVKEVLQTFHLDPELVVAVLDGVHDPSGGFFAGPINFDTIEGILRTRRYATKAVSGLTSDRVVQAATERSDLNDQNVVDNFWNEKHEVYARIIRSREGVLSDHLCQTLARRHLSRLSELDYLTTEAALFRKIPEMQDALRLGLDRAINKYSIAYPIEYVARTFYVDQSRIFFDHEDAARYRQIKSVKEFDPTATPLNSPSISVQLDLLAQVAL